MNKPPCSECGKPLVRGGGEHLGNWKRKVTCSAECSIKRSNRLRSWSAEDEAIAVRMKSEGCDYGVIGQRLSRRRAGETVRTKLQILARQAKEKLNVTPCATQANKKSGVIPCLKCRKPFKTVDRRRNRLCQRCTYQNQEAYDNTVGVGGLI